MKSNRLITYNFSQGNTADATRIEQALIETMLLCDDVPADLVQRRWSPSHLVWGFSPPQLVGAPSAPLPFLSNFVGVTPVTPQMTNSFRNKSNNAPGLAAINLLTWEVSAIFSRPVIIGALTVFAENSDRNNGPHNPWIYGATNPGGFPNLSPTQDFSLQACVSDGWDLENRKKLRQESLVYNMRSDAFLFSSRIPTGAPTGQPKPAYNSKWNGFAVLAGGLVLVPAGARVFFQWTIPQYNLATDSTWPLDPRTGNVWSLCAQVYSATQKFGKTKTIQFPVTRFARGTKLLVEHEFTPLQLAQTSALAADFEDTVEDFAVTSLQWNLPWIGSKAVDGLSLHAAMLVWPWVAPPFQQLFARTTLVDPQYPVELTEICLSIDQCANPFATLDAGGANPGDLVAVDMARYNMVLKLFERTPSLLTATTAGDATTGDLTSQTQLLRIDIDGVNCFGLGQIGTSIARQNPLITQNLRINIKPFMVYQWTLECAGLFDAVVAGVKDVWQFTISGTPVAGNTIRLVIAGNDYDFVCADGVPTNIATGIAAAAAADPLYTVTSALGVVTLTQITAGVTIITPQCLFLNGNGTVFGAHVVVGTNPTGGGPRLSLNSLNLVATLRCPLTARDQTTDFSVALSPGLSNIPNIHGGEKAGTTIPLTLPAANTTITGDDVQDAVHGFDVALRKLAPSGYGVGFGALADPLFAANRMPAELLANDSHLSIIMEPMWGGQAQESIRIKDLGLALNDNLMGLPYTKNPFTANGAGLPATQDCRAIPIPEGFVLHHAFVVWNGFSPKGSTLNHGAAAGVWPVNAGFFQQVGVYQNSGWGSDDYKEQQIAYLEWDADPADATVQGFRTYLLDQFGPSTSGTYRLMQIPLVAPNGTNWSAHSWFKSGLPFFTGRGTTITQSRSRCSNMPDDFGGGAIVTPLTKGGENTLVVRWGITIGNIGAMTDNDVVIGQGGAWIFLCGRQTVVG